MTLSLEWSLIEHDNGPPVKAIRASGGQLSCNCYVRPAPSGLRPITLHRVSTEDTMDVESGRDLYRPVDGFFKRPKGWTFIEVGDVAVDADDNVYVFCRGAHPVMIFDK